MNRTQLTIGIPAYNEQANIKRLLSSLFGQRQSTYDLKEIIVVSDGSTDMTVAEALSVHNPIIKVLDNKERIGAALRQNDILSQAQGDAIVILDADILITDTYFLHKMLRPIAEDQAVGIVGARVLPLPAKSFFEKVIVNSNNFKRSVYESMRNKDNIYLCHGRARAFSRKFASQLHFPKAIGEDAFSYIRCVQAGFKFVYNPEAEIHYRCPQNLNDHLRQSVRFLKAKQIWEHASEGKKYYRIPLNLLLRKAVRNFFSHPILFPVYFLVFTLAKLRSNNTQVDVIWEVSPSSKTLAND